MSVYFGSRTRPSGQTLEDALRQGGYDGPDINFGYGMRRNALNAPEALRLAANKRLALEKMAETDVPTPRLVYGDEAMNPNDNGSPYPIVGRPDSHRQGRGFWLCNSGSDVERAVRGTRRKAAATHFMEFIEAEKEFRVHIVNGKSIKISEKVGGGNHGQGATFRYPEDFNHKKTLRRTAAAAVEALGLDFGAVDILWADDQPYVLEVNSAPCLTDHYSDTLSRYVNAFLEEYGDIDDLAIHRDSSTTSHGDGDSDDPDICLCGDPDCDTY